MITKWNPQIQDIAGGGKNSRERLLIGCPAGSFRTICVASAGNMTLWLCDPAELL